MGSISLCMIVRNEAEFLSECLHSVEGIVDEVIIVDTGSTDHTMNIAQKFGAHCYSVPWIHDFAYTRNISLGYASMEYILVLDADEILTTKGRAGIKKSLIEFPNAAGFFIHILNQTDGEGIDEIEESLNVRLFRNNPQYRYSGALHEQIAESILHANPPGIIFDSQIELLHRGYLKKVVMDKGKKERNLEIAIREAEAYPTDGFRAFNLGMEYVRLKQFDKAVHVFQNATKWADPKALWVSRFYKIYISTLMQMGEWEEADRLLKEAIPLFPDYTDLFYLRGVYFSQKHEWLLALKAFAMCIEMGDPPLPPYTIEKGISTYRAYFAMGQAFQSMSKIAEAIVAYRKAFEMNSTFTQAFLRLANLLLRDDSGDPTLDYLTSLAVVAGEHKNTLLGMSLALSDQFEQAEIYLENAEKTQDVLEHLTVTYACLNRQDKLRQLLDQYDPKGELRAQARAYLLDRGRTILQQGLLKFPQSEMLLRLQGEYGMDCT